ncbi:MAG: DUF4215 domain-containing protein [Myxococcota bacterium]
MASLERFVIGLFALPLSACFNPPTIMETDDGSSGGTADGSSGEVVTSTAPGVTTDVADTSGDAAGCGDGTVDTGEECDDGGTAAGDGCSDACVVETGYVCDGEPSVCEIDCGDGIILGDEACDDANDVDGDGCTACVVDGGAECTGEPSVCVSPDCGNGVLNPGEGCDDANSESGDGCTEACSVEMYYRCEGAGEGTCNPVRILYMLGGPIDDEVFRDEISAVVGSDTGFFDAAANLPSDLILNDYDCVITHPQLGYFNATVTGVLLVNYVNSGGTVVLGPGAGVNGGGLGGTMIMAQEYSPVSVDDVVALRSPAVYSGDGSTLIHDGVASYDALIIDTGVQLQGGGVADANYTNGVISVAYRPDFKVVYTNGSGHLDFDGSGDWARLFANACSVGYTM